MLLLEGIFHQLVSFPLSFPLSSNILEYIRLAILNKMAGLTGKGKQSYGDLLAGW